MGVERGNYCCKSPERPAGQKSVIGLTAPTNAVHVTVDDKGYSIDQVIDGETVAEVLDYVQYNPKKLVRTLETWVTKSVKEGRISVEEGKEFLSNYRSGLYGYTYLE